MKEHGRGRGNGCNRRRGGVKQGKSDEGSKRGHREGGSGQGERGGGGEGAKAYRAVYAPASCPCFSLSMSVCQLALWESYVNGFMIA